MKLEECRPIDEIQELFDIKNIKIKELSLKLDMIKELIESQNDITDYYVAMGTFRLSKEELKQKILNIIGE